MPEKGQTFIDAYVTPNTAHISRIIRNWPAEYVPFARPFVVCTLLGSVCRDLHKRNREQLSPLLLLVELIKLVLKRIGTYWGVAHGSLGRSRALPVAKRYTN
jgi:hypothetical protein